MSQNIGKITSTSGSVTVITPEGASVVPTPNMGIAADAIVQTGVDGDATIEFANGTTLNIGGDEFVLIDESVYTDEALPEDETQTEAQKLQAILAENPDLSVFEETASGEAVAVGGSSLIVDSIEAHNAQDIQSGSSMLELHENKKSAPVNSEDDEFVLISTATDTTPLITLSDLITNNTLPTITGTVSSTTATVIITVGDKEITATNNGDGTWSLPITDTLPEGDTTISVVTIDENGNDTTVTAMITIDTIDPVLTVDPITTNDSTPTIGGTINEDDATVVVTINGTDHTATNNGDGTWSLPITDTLPEGDTVITVVATDPAGNTSSETETIVVDTIAPSITIDPLITNDTTPLITGTTDDPDAKIVVTVNNGTLSGTDYVATVNPDGTWSVEITDTLDEGDTSISVTATDTTGNSDSTTGSVTVDISNDDHNGTGTGTNGDDATIALNDISGDNRINTYETQNSTTVISGSTTAVDGSVISILVNDNLFTTVTAQNGTFSYSVDNDVFANYPDGIYTVKAEVVADQAGNMVSSSKEVLLDTDFVTEVKLDETLFGDNIINLQESTSDVLYIKGTSTAANGTTVEITVDGNTFTTATVQDGIFSTNIDPNVFSAFSDGSYNLKATIRDIAGNETSDTATITLDRTLDGGSNSEPITVDSITEDTGASDSDFITSDNNLLIKGTYSNEVGNDIVITIGSNTYSTVDGTIDVTGNQWSLNTGVLDDGSTTITAIISDTAGNTKTITQDLVIDTVADNGDGTTPAAITLDPISDGAINGQETGAPLTITGTSNVIGATVNITINGNAFTSATVEADGSYSVTVDTTTMKSFPDGEYVVDATIITDAAGNSVSASRNVTLDTTLDDGGDYGSDNVTIEGITTDTGVAGDYITSDTTLVVNGTFNGELGNSVIVRLDDTVYDVNSPEFSVDAANNTWSLNLENTPLTEGVYALTAIVQDDAGNTETISQDINIVDSTDLGVINLDEISGNYINAQEATTDIDITGTSSAIGKTVEFKLNGQVLDLGNGALTAVVQGDGTFNITIPADTFTAYSDGEYNVTASVVAADGILYSDTENVILDRTVSGQDASIVLEDVSGGYINQQDADDGILLTGTTTAGIGTKISFIFTTADGLEYPVTETVNGQEITANADGTFSAFIALGDLSGIDNSTVSVTAQVVADQAGNLASSESVDVAVDLSAGTLSDDTAPTDVYESALDLGTDPSMADRSTSGNILANDVNITNSHIENVSINGVVATPLAGATNIYTVQTESGTFFIATEDTTFDNKSYEKGEYLYVLENASSNTQEQISYTLSDDAGNSATATLNINIVDDQPVAETSVDKYLDSTTSGYSTNLILTLDTSGSMNLDAEGDAPGDRHYEGFWPFGKWVDDYNPDTVRIDLAKDALKNLIDQYDDLGDVNIQIITFSDTATASEMLNATDAKAYIDNISADGGTNYDSAVEKAMENPADAYPDATTTQYYFISDGQPNSGKGLDTAETTAWNNYIDASPIDKTFAIGVGNSGNKGELDNIAAANGETIIIDSITDLDGSLQQTVNNTIITGELTSFDADGTVINIGADGGHISLVEINGVSYAYDSNNPTQTITTPLDATLTINYETGSYTYLVDYNATNAGQTESLDISVLENDGNTATNTITFHLETAPNGDENFAYDASTTIDGAAGFDAVVLSGAETLDFDNISNLSNMEAIDMSTGDNSVMNLEVADIINMTDGDNVLTIYGESGDSVSKPTGSSETWTQTSSGVDDGKGHTVDVYSVTDGSTTVTVNIEQEIVVS